MKLLIADDSEILRISLKKLLQPVQEIDQVFEASDPVGAIDMINRYYPDVMILDLRLHDGNGFEVMDYLAEHSLEILVIVLTNFATEHNEQKSYDKGAHYFFDKTHDYEQLEQVIRSYA
mgnify:FL=1